MRLITFLSEGTNFVPVIGMMALTATATQQVRMDIARNYRTIIVHQPVIILVPLDKFGL
ncbi:hypothetical protein WUBG_07546 [Wuchereria bancrofti]|uniref:Uncharacterized protein n=1 Tax=Wuchereria bancrofti TaxID=6293 RepID=J9B3L2_WUCBA|nr:hypothetical protein WUBG_07546 [Wuchereria bancrofti]VDM10198.1 unnamed protein product [Wuchereria bancrofti]